MKKYNVLIFVFIFLFSTPHTAVAQQFQTDSNSIRTTIGKPPVDSGLIAAGQDLKHAFDFCANGYTNFTLTLQACLAESLTSSGRPQDRVNSFVNEYPLTIAGGCTQCLGFVRLTTALANGNGQGLALNSAADVASLNSFTTGGAVYQRVTGNPQSGDIGARGSGDGHIVIVYKIEPPDNSMFTALEANGAESCRVTDYRQLNKELFNFFRKQ